MPRVKHGLPAIYNATALSLSDGDGVAPATDSAGRLIVGGGGVASGATDSGNPVKVGGVYNSTPPTFTNGQRGDFQIDASGNQLVSLATLIAGENLTTNKMVVEHNYSYLAPVTADTQVKASAGFIHTVTISQNDAAPTAGSIIIYDNTAESGTQVFNWTLTTAVFNPVTIILDVACATGIYVGFTTTADVNVQMSYR